MKTNYAVTAAFWHRNQLIEPTEATGKTIVLTDAEAKYLRHVVVLPEPEVSVEPATATDEPDPVAAEEDVADSADEAVEVFGVGSVEVEASSNPRRRKGR